jgi:predicted RNase H-like HicB family nuclease
MEIIMKFIYPAVFSKTDDGNYQGYFPDLECCYAKGDTLEDAVDDANEAAYNWISLELSEEDCSLPSVSDVSDMNLKEGDIVRNISVNIRFYEGWDE